MGPTGRGELKKFDTNRQYIITRLYDHDGNSEN